MKERDLVWNKLEKLAKVQPHVNFRAVSKRSQRHDVFSFRLNNLFVDLSKNLIDQEVLKIYRNSQPSRSSMNEEGLFSGAILNNTEKRPALHVALRTPRVVLCCQG